MINQPEGYTSLVSKALGQAKHAACLCVVHASPWPQVVLPRSPAQATLSLCLSQPYTTAWQLNCSDRCVQSGLPSCDPPSAPQPRGSALSAPAGPHAWPPKRAQQAVSGIPTLPGTAAWAAPPGHSAPAAAGPTAGSHPLLAERPCRVHMQRGAKLQQ